MACREEDLLGWMDEHPNSIKGYWDILGSDLHMLNESLAYGSIPLSCRRAVVTLLPKEDNLLEIKN